ncbi:uncharacterized protein LOC143219026 [Lasioglossum baleicum]|uniref:uncharacterized protein LOC143219026 n=1 Tax=Lasioglossum baleicum TaxID=434251 RepID=UPI003FCD3B01
MRLVYLSSILLTITICGIASNNAAPTNEDKSATAPAVTTAVPQKPAIAANSDAGPNASVVTSSTTTVTTNATVAKVNDTSKIDTNMTTTPFAVNVTSKPTTVPSTTKETPTTTVKPTEKPKTTSVEPPATTSSQTTVSPSVTTAIPISTKEAPPHKERQFDGLSFVGGIILTISLMAIATFSYKFYRTMNERNYRIL